MSKAAIALENVRRVVCDALDDMKAEKVVVLDVRDRTAITDLMVFASGSSRRHVKSLADNVVEKATQAGMRPLGVEGRESADWVLVDLGDAVVHVMLPDIRDFYRLEHIWGMDDDLGEKADGGRGGSLG